MSPRAESPGTAAPGPRVATSVGLLLTGHVAAIGVGFATVIVVSRVLDAEALGRWRLAQAILTYLIVLTDMGLTSLAVREIARGTGDVSRFAGPVLLLRLGVSILIAPLAVVGVLMAGPPADVAVFYAVTFLSVIPAALSLLHVAQGRERMATFALARLALTALAGLLGLGSLLLTRELVALAIWPLIIGMTVDVCLVWLTVGRFGIRLSAGSPTVWVSLLRMSAPFLIGAVAIQLVSNADAIIIGSLRGEAQLGVYAAAYLLAGQTLFLSGPIAAALYPRLAHLHQRRTGFSRALEQTTGVLGLVVLPFCIAVAILSDDIVLLLYGERYIEASSLLSILIGMPLIGFYNVAVAQGLNAAGAQRTVMRVSLLAAVTSVGMNLALVPTVGLLGAAVTAVATEAITAVLYTAAGRGLVGLNPLRAYIQPLGAAIPMGAVALVAQRGGIPLAGILVIAVTTYAALIRLTNPGAMTALGRALGRARDR